MTYAWVAIGIYPVGLLLTVAGLLWRARRSILSPTPPTALSCAISFLYREYDPHMFWWVRVRVRVTRALALT